MSSSARSYVSRAPRYVFRPGDQNFMRFAPMETRGIAWHALVRDLSESGLSFELGDATAPDEGEMLKLEFALPGRHPIACFATVVRVEKREEWDPTWGDRGYTVVALQFRNLPSAHRRALQKALANKTEPEHDFDFTSVRRVQMLKLAGFTVALAFSFVAMTYPFESWLAPLRHLLRA